MTATSDFNEDLYQECIQTIHDNVDAYIVVSLVGGDAHIHSNGEKPEKAIIMAAVEAECDL